MIDIIKKEQCTGCKMCGDICPVNAISYEVDKYGFWYPSVNYDKCIKCKKCVNTCPSLNLDNNRKMAEPKVYSIWSRNPDVRLSSTSGGAFYEFGKYIIEHGGMVAGAVFGEDWKSAKHIIIEDLDGLDRLKGSKYFQSDSLGIYKKVKEAAAKGRRVLFCGTPCQIAAMDAYLGTERENVILMDFICRSINSPRAFSAYVSELEKEYGSKVSHVHLKYKRFGWQMLSSRVCFENGKESVKDKTQDWWVKGFIYNDLYTRESCFNCNYRTHPRIATDLTIADFWGIKNQSLYDNFAGISAIMINSEKGNNLFKSVSDKFIVKQQTYSDLLEGNPALKTNPVKSSKQDKFFNLLDSKSFSEAVSECIKLPLAKRIKGYTVKFLKESRRIISYAKSRNISASKYIYYNYFCKNIIRTGTAKIVPYTNCVMNLAKTSRIYLRGERDMHIGINKLKGSKAETHIRMSKGAIWKCNHGGQLFFNTTLEIKEDAKFDTGYFTVNGGSVIIAHKHIILGEDVMLGRNIIIYDSDFHQIWDNDGKPCNQPQTVKIGDHVWLTSNITVLKGVTIGRDSLITAQTVVNKNMPEHSIIAGGASGKAIKDSISWCRDIIPHDMIIFDEE